MRLTLLCDYAEESWPSMDLVAEMLARHLRRERADDIALTLVKPSFRERVLRALPKTTPLVGPAAFNADRLLNRFVDYPRHVRREARAADALHVCDHSYAQLALAASSTPVGVYCHDIDAFRCLVDPVRHPRPRWFRMMAGRILRGLQRAAVVFHSTAAVREELVRFDLVDPDLLVWAPYGAAPEFRPAGTASSCLQPRAAEGRYLVHVGSLIRRKRIDVLLEAFAGVAQRHPDVRLVQVGPPWSGEQERVLERFALRGRVVKLTGLSRDRLAEVYRGATLALLPSDAEGFGFPVLEALACGTSVVASDIPSVREVGGDVVTYLPPGDVAAWVDGVDQALAAPERLPALELRLEQAARFSWSRHASIIADAYHGILAR